MNGTSGFQAGCGKTISAQQRFDGLHVWDNRRTRSQDAQKGRPARPQQAKWRCVLCAVRRATERSENAAGELFQHPVRSAVFYLPITIAYRFQHEKRHQFVEGSWHLIRNRKLRHMTPQVRMTTPVFPASQDRIVSLTAKRLN
jgi:hypothetical protein